MFKFRKSKIIAIDAIIKDIESAISSLKSNEKIMNMALYRQEKLTEIYNNEQLAIFKLNCLASNLRGARH